MYQLKGIKPQIYPKRGSNSTSKPFPEIKNITGHYNENTVNILGLPTGSLVNNKNCEYGINSKYVYAKTRRGSSVVVDTTTGSLGMGIARKNNDTYVFWIDSTGKLKYIVDGTTTVVNTGSTFATSVDTDFFFYNHPSYPTLYLCNTTNGVYKVAMSTLTVSAVASSPNIARMAFSHISGRLFGIDNAHKVYWTEIQQTTAVDVTNIEAWNTGTNFAIISPDYGDGFRAIIDDGNSLFVMKDVGVWCLPNANESTANWIFPKLKVDIGTSAPKTVKQVRYKDKNGIAFFANDATIRFFTGYVNRNSGTTPTFMEGDTLILSDDFQSDLDTISRSYFSKSASSFYDGIYSLSYASNSASAVDKMVCVDFEKGSQYWFDFENYTISNFERTKDKLYAFDTRGFIVSIFETDKIFDEIPSRLSAYTDDVVDSTDSTIKQVAIRWSFYFGWIKISDYLQRLVNGYVNFTKDGNQPLYMKVNSFIKGDYIPTYDSGVTTVLNTQISGASYWDSSFWDSGKFLSSSNIQTNARTFSNGEGNYFNFGFYSDDIYQTARVYSVQANFKQIRNTPNVSN